MAFAFSDLFGEKVLRKDASGKPELVSTNEILDGKHVFVYFSAHWCPPCRGFTPKLAQFHSTFHKAKGFETIFVSGDRDQASFDEYYGEQPWLALPFDNKTDNAKLNKKFGVKGIPALMVLGPDGKLITKDGRSKVMENMDTCEGFPWKPPSFSEVFGDEFLKQDGSKVDKSAIAGKTLGLYFSAHWCPPCRGFTPKLKEFYTEYKQKDPNFEIVFVSSDKTEADMKSYFNNDHGDYLVLPFENRKAKEQLSEMFGIEGIPSFVVLDKDGSVLNTNGRGKIAAGVQAVLAEGWAPPAVGDLSEGPEAAGTDINETPSIVILCDKCDAGKQKEIKDMCTPLAQKFIEKGKKSDENPDYIFLLATSQGGVVSQLKELTKKDIGEKLDAAGDKPVMLLFDIPDNGAFYFSTDDVTTASIEGMIAAKETGSLPRCQLSR